MENSKNELPVVANYRKELEAMTEIELANEYENQTGVLASDIIEDMDIERKSIISELVNRWKQSLASRGELYENKFRDIVREVIMGMDVSESDALYAKKEDWQASKKKIRANMIELLKHIEEDEYEQGVKEIASLIDKLKNWQIKIQKFID